MEQQLSRARRLTDTFESILSEMKPNSKNLISSEVMSKLQHENIDIGKKKYESSLHRFLTEKLQYLQEFIRNNSPPKRREENI